MANNILYPDPLDEAYQFSWKPESDIPSPYKYRFYIRDGETGEIITPNENQDYWYETDVPLEDSPFKAGEELTGRINISQLLARNGYKYGLYLLSAHLYNTEEDRLAEREQSAYIYIIENGLKPPSLP